MHRLSEAIAGASIALIACSPVRVSVRPGTQTVEPGGVAIFTVQVSRFGFQDPVPLTLSPASSPHYTALLQPNPVSGTQAQLSVQFALTAPFGPYALDVQSTPATPPPFLGAPSNRANVVVGPCGARWITQFGTSGSDDAWSIKRGPSGDLFVLTHQGGDTFAMRFDSGGGLRWQELIPEADAMDVDPRGNLVVASTITRNLSSEYQLRRYTPLGNLDWAVTLGLEDRITPGVTGVVTDGSGNVFVVGATYGGLGGSNPDNTQTALEGWIAKADPSGTLLWLRQTLTLDHDLYVNVTVDQAGGVFALRVTEGAPPALQKFDAATGDLVWSQNLPSPLGGGALASDAAGNIFVTFDGSPPQQSPALVKYSPAGVPLWSATLDTRGIRFPAGVAIDASGGSLVVGHELQGTSLGNTRIARFDTNGAWDWGLSFDAPFSIWNLGGNPIDVDPAGDIYLAGSTAGSFGSPNRGGTDAWLGKLRQGGCGRR